MIECTQEDGTVRGFPMRHSFDFQVTDGNQLYARLSGWKERLEASDNPVYRQTCQNMIRLYETRIDRLGVKVTCAD